jgi:hypothetical protein
MRKRRVRYQAVFGFVALSLSSGLTSWAGTEATATKSLTVQPAGPRPGEAGSRYFNVEGAKNERYASFGVLVFQLPRGKDEGDVGKLSLRLVQSIPSFAKDGKVRFLLAEPHDQATDALTGLKFDPMSPDGLGKDAFKAVHPLGFGTFAKVRTGQADTFALTLEQAGRAYLRGQLKAGGTILIVLVPDDEEVAATYFGAGSEPEANRPQLVIESGTRR